MEVMKIWDKAPHNAFTDLIRYRGSWLCTFREGQAHASPDGVIRILTSYDGVAWKSAALLKSSIEDLRDPKFSITPDGRLMLSGVGALHKPNPVSHQSYSWFSKDRRTWSDAVPVGEPDFWLWRMTWHKGIGYCVGHEFVKKQTLRLYRSRDGQRFETLVANFYDQGGPNESKLIFLPDDTALCLMRRRENALLGTARPPYVEWEWKDAGCRIGGPDMLQLPDGRIIAGVRLYDGNIWRTSLCWLNQETGRLDECLKLPSGGDCSYTGLAWHEGLLWVSYYSSHEGKTAIYLARIKADELSGRGE